jgi:hypothetical protein
MSRIRKMPTDLLDLLSSGIRPPVGAIAKKSLIA